MQVACGGLNVVELRLTEFNGLEGRASTLTVRPGPSVRRPISAANSRPSAEPRPDQKLRKVE